MPYLQWIPLFSSAVLAASCLAISGCKVKADLQPQLPRKVIQAGVTAPQAVDSGSADSEKSELRIPAPSYPSLPPKGLTSKDFAPAGWAVECELIGDISKDGIPDLVLVLHQKAAGNMVSNRGRMGPDTLDTNPRILAVALGRPGNEGYSLVTQNHDLIPRHIEPNMEDPLGSCPEIKKGSLRVTLGFFANAGTWFTSNSTFVFRYQDSSLRLIGFDYNDVARNTGESHSKSINFLTGIMTNTDGNISEENGKPLVSKIRKDTIITIDAVGDGGAFWHSDSEDQIKMELPKEDPLFFVTWAGGKWFAGGMQSGLMTSTDGVTMVPKISNGSYEVGTILTSPDAETWTRLNTGLAYDVRCLIRAEKRFMAVGGENILSSADGLSWTDKGFPSDIPSGGKSILWIGTEFIVVTGNGQGGIASSPDGNTWTKRWSSFDHGLNSIAWSGHLMAAVGSEGLILTSTDGTTWNSRQSKTEQRLEFILWANHKFVVVGDQGNILTSPDGVVWTKRNSGTYYPLSSITWTGTQWVAVGSEGTVLTSPDAVHWTQRKVATPESFASVAWGESVQGKPSLLVAVSDYGAVWTSLDGIKWVKKKLTH